MSRARFCLRHELALNRALRSARSAGIWTVTALLLLVLATVIVAGDGAYAQGCIDYRDYLHWVGSVAMPGSAQDVAVAGNYAYVADESSGLQVVDLSDPAAPRIIGGTTGASRSVAVAGDYAYVADDGEGFQVVSILNPASPEIAGAIPMPEVAWNVAVAGDYAYVAVGGAGLVVVDISTAATPEIAGSVPTPGSARDVAVAGGHAYVAAYDAGLCVVDISDPALPAIVGNCPTPLAAQGVVVVGDNAYLACTGGVSEGMLVVVNISDPTRPAVAGGVATWREAQGVAVAGSHAYVADAENGLEVVDVSNPATPAVVGNCATRGAARGVVLAGDYAYVASAASPGPAMEAGLEVVDISNPLPAAVVGHARTVTATDVALSGHYACVTTYFEGFFVVNVSNPAAPEIVWNGGGEHFLQAVTVSGDYAYVAGTWATTPTFCILVLDISNPASPAVVGHAILDLFTGEPSDIAIAGDYAYMTDSSYHGALVVVDVSDPTWPYEVGRIETGYPALAVAVAGGYAFLANDDYGLRVVDVSKPSSPAIVGGVATPGQARGVVLVGDRAYVADYRSGLQVADISVPTSPVILGGVVTPGRAEGVAVSGDIAYVADRRSGIQVMDISNAATPLIFGGGQNDREFFALEGAREVVLNGEYAYVADYFGFFVRPAQCAGPTPVELASCEIRADDGAVSIVWETSFAADHLGFHVERAELGRDRFVRVNDELICGAADGPSLYRFVDRSVEVGRTYVYRLIAVDLRGGTQTFAIGSVTVGGARPGAIVLHQNQPNPFSASTSITFELPGAAAATLRIYDAHGRLVRTLAGGIVSHGAGSFEWDGRDDRGRRLGAGVYVYRLDTGGQTLSKRLLMLR